jgi:hypothetical protein
MKWLPLVFAFGAASAVAAEPATPPATNTPVNRTDAVNATAAPPVATTRPFGIAPEGLTSPELSVAVQKRVFSRICG